MTNLLWQRSQPEKPFLLNFAEKCCVRIILQAYNTSLRLLHSA